MSFDRLARHYSWMERVLAGGQLQLCRRAYLKEVAQCGSVLLIGEGHGRFLLDLCLVSPSTQIVYVDESGRMAEVARQRLVRHGVDPGRVQFVVGSIDAATLPQGCEAVVTNFFLDCFDAVSLERIIPKIAGSLRNGGIWLVCDF